MKGFVLVLALYAGAFGPGFGIAVAQPPIPRVDINEPFAFACKVLEVDCTNIPPPRIEWFVEVFNTQGHSVDGGYDGGDSIALSGIQLWNADQVWIDSVLAHESAHYLDVQTGFVTLPFTYESVCASEAHGWRVGNAYVIVNDRPQWADFNWAERYACFL
jgi:hypothetical protein